MKRIYFDSNATGQHGGEDTPLSAIRAFTDADPGMFDFRVSVDKEVWICGLLHVDIDLANNSNTDAYTEPVIGMTLDSCIKLVDGSVKKGDTLLVKDVDYTYDDTKTILFSKLDDLYVGGCVNLNFDVQHDPD